MRVIALAAVLFLLAVSVGWGGGVGVSDSATFTRGVRGNVWSISCAAPGECAAGGSYRVGSYRLGLYHEAFVVGERNGVWGKPIEVPGTAKLNSGGNARVRSISCAAAGECAAGGYYLDRRSRYQAFVVSETNGRWGTAIEVPGMETLNRGRGDLGLLPGGWSISCAAPGECAAGGYYLDRDSHHQAFVVSETNGSWGTAIGVPGTATLNEGGYADVTSNSCAAAGECAAGGYYVDGSGNYQVFVVSETHGSWGTAIEVPDTATLNAGGDADLISISCGAAGECAAGGFYEDGNNDTQAFVVSETNGSWGNAIEVPGTATLNTGGSAWMMSISCAAVGECAAVGFYSAAGSGDQAFVVSETNGSWGNAIEVPGTATLNTGGYAEASSISCAAAGECAAVGFYDDGNDLQAFVVSETNGSWGTAIEVPGVATLNAGGVAEANSISCAAAGECTAGGYYYESFDNRRAFLVDEANGSWRNAIQLRFPAACVVPNVVGKAISAARKRLNAARCGVGKITYVYSNLQKGRVVAERPKPGKILRAGAGVALTVSKG